MKIEEMKVKATEKIANVANEVTVTAAHRFIDEHMKEFAFGAGAVCGLIFGRILFSWNRTQIVVVK